MTHIGPEIPADESERLAELAALNLLDTPAEEAFDGLARLAAFVCGTPIALVSLVDAERQWFKARVGLKAAETPRDISFCGHAIAYPDQLLVVTVQTTMCLQKECQSRSQQWVAANLDSP